MKISWRDNGTCLEVQLTRRCQPIRLRETEQQWIMDSRNAGFSDEAIIGDLENALKKADPNSAPPLQETITRNLKSLTGIVTQIESGPPSSGTTWSTLSTLSQSRESKAQQESDHSPEPAACKGS